MKATVSNTMTAKAITSMSISLHLKDQGYIRIYAGGDAVTGVATVISAMGAGKVAARSIDEALSSN